MRTGVVGIMITSVESVPKVQETLTTHSKVIVGRMGVPDRENGQNVIALIVKGSVEDISALCGALGRIANVKAKSVLTA